MPTYRAVGLMSGTSLDGVDAALCRVRLPADAPLPEATVEVEAALTDEYGSSFRSALERCCTPEATPETVARANVAVADRFADAVDRLLAEASVAAEEVDLIGSHGQTIWHAPEPGRFTGSDGRWPGTLQIGDGNVLAWRTGVDVVSDFRTADLAAGGQGAPLSPLLDLLQFGDSAADLIVQNVGGIGNCTVLPASGKRGDVTAFDTGPGNMVVDAVVARLTDNLRYDEDGRMATAGTVDEALLAELLDDPFFDRAPPKSTGRERFGAEYAEEVLERAEERGLGDAGIVATATALTVRSIADAYDRHVAVDPDRVVVSGGGAHNDALVSMLGDAIDCSVETVADHGVDPDFREAALFALLAAAYAEGRPGNLPSVTGADEGVVLGKRAKG